MSPASPRARWRRRALIAVQLAAGLVLGLVLTEMLFDHRAAGAFPHVNFYVADPELGVRLEPGASMKFQLGTNPLTTIHVNAQGYRGDDWPAPSEGEIVVLGDSQVFGLGVEDDETFSAKLAAATGRTVLNAGVPTYGPPEYLLLARELLAERSPQTLIVTLNYLNDPFEIDRPNKDRHAVWDGWAVRSEHAPEHVREFPGRKWLYSQSQAFYAVRRWQHERAGEALDLGTPGEGSYQDLLTERQRAQAAIDDQIGEAEQSLAKSRERITRVEGELTAKRDELDELLQVAGEREFTRLDRQLARGRPGDIVDRKNAERSRSTKLTAALIREAARERKQATAKLLRAQELEGETTAKLLVDAETALVGERRQLRAQLATGVAPLAPAVSVFDPFLRELDELCKQHGTELIVIALPVDVQVDPAEWDKYGVPERPDMSESLILIDDLVANAEVLRIRALDATVALRSAEPGAFLDHDIHMTAKGHAALAEALTKLVSVPAAWPVTLPNPGLPQGLGFVPEAQDWDPIHEVRVDGSSKAGCTTMIEGDWFKLRCARRTTRDEFGGIEILEGATPATMAMHHADGLSLVTPLRVGEHLRARLHWQSTVRELWIRWPIGEDGEPHFLGTLAVVDAVPLGQTPSDAVAPVCACHRERTGEAWCEVDESDGYALILDRCQPSCAELWGDPGLIEPCTNAFPDDCTKLLACVQNDPLTAPACPAGSVHAFASNACFAACDDAHPCSRATCTPWQGASVCVPRSQP